MAKEFKVYDKACKNCLLSADAIVSPGRVRDILNETKEKGNFFVCHVSSIHEDGNVCCKNYFDKFGDSQQLIRVAKRLGVVNVVELPDTNRLPSHKEINRNQ